LHSIPRHISSPKLKSKKTNPLRAGFKLIIMIVILHTKEKKSIHYLFMILIDF